MRKIYKLSRIVLLLFSLFLVILFMGCNSSGEKQGENNEEEQAGKEPSKFVQIEEKIKETIGLKTKVADTSSVPDYLEAIGEVIPDSNLIVNITPIVGGKVKEVNVNLGNYVDQGTLLSLVSSPDLAMAISDYGVSLEKMNIASRNLKIKEQFASTGAFSGPPYENKKQEFASSKLDLATAKKNLKVAETNLDSAALELKKISAMEKSGEYSKRPLEEAKNQYTQAESEFLQAKNQLEKSEIELHRSEKLYEAGLISKKELLSVQTDYQNGIVHKSQAQAQMEVAKGILEREQIIYDKNIRNQVELQSGESKYIQAQKEYEQSLSAYEKSKESLSIIEKQVEREKAIFSEDLNTAQEIQQAQASYGEAKIEYEKAVSVLDTYGISPETVKLYTGGNLPVTSPIKGYILERNINRGEVVKPDTVMFKVLDTTSLWIDSEIYEKDLAKVKVGQTVEITTNAYPEEVFIGKIFYISNSFHQESRTFDVRVSFDNRKNLLKPGMTVNSRITTGEIKGLILPSEAVLDDEGKKVIFIAVKDKENVFERREVTIKALKNNEYLILSGLSSGETVVTDGAFQLRSQANRRSIQGGEE